MEISAKKIYEALQKRRVFLSTCQYCHGQLDKDKKDCLTCGAANHAFKQDQYR